jgi:acyl-CoA oxidase
VTTTTARLAQLDDPQLRAFLPLLYVVWADLELEPHEARDVRARLATQPWLRPAARLALETWLDPDAPPSAAELGRLHALVEGIAKTTSPRARRSLVALAESVATSEESREAARQFASLLGLVDGDEERPAMPAPATGMLLGEIEALGEFFDGPDRAVRERVRAFLGTGSYRAYGLPTEAMRTKVRGWISELAATGLGELAFPGVTCPAADQRAFMTSFEELATGDLSLLVKWGVQVGLYGGAIYALGTARHHARLQAVARCEELGCFAMSEVGHGSNVADLETIARYDHATRELVVHTPAESARKEWIGGAAHDARWAVVFAQLEVGDANHGVHAVLVPIRDAGGAPAPGVRIGDCGHKLGLNGVDNGRLWFEHVRVPVGNLLDRFARIDEHGAYESPIASPSKRFFVMLGTLVAGRVTVGSAGGAAARAGLAIAIRYALARRQFGEGTERTLLQYPTHRRRLLPHLATNVVLRLAFARLRDRHAAGFVGVGTSEVPDNRALEADAAALKVLGSRHGVDALQACREACGGQGYLSVNRLGDLRVDVDVFTTFEGDNTVLLQLVAKSVLAGYQKQFTDGGPLAVLRVVGRRVATSVLQKNPAQTRRTDREHLRDRHFQLDALRYRELRLTETCAARLRKRLSGKRPADTAMLEVQEHLVELADAYAERLAFEWFALAEAGAPEAARPALRVLGNLHVLALLERRSGWFLEDDYFEDAKVSAIHKEVAALLEDVAAIAPGVVEAFRIPDRVLAAPIAFFDPAYPRYE